MYRPWDRLCKVTVRFKGGSDYDVNDLPESTRKQWEVDAKNWNDFILKYEPRIDYATEILTDDQTNAIKGSVKSSIFDAYDKGVGSKPQDSGAVLRNTGNLGSALAAGEIEAEEKSKDYQVNNLNSALNILHGEKSAALQNLSTISNEAAKLALSGTVFDNTMDKQTSANIGTGITAIASTAKNWGK